MLYSPLNQSKNGKKENVYVLHVVRPPTRQDLWPEAGCNFFPRCKLMLNSYLAVAKMSVSGIAKPAKYSSKSHVRVIGFGSIYYTAF